MDVSFVAGHQVGKTFFQFEVIHKCDWAITLVFDVCRSVALEGVETAWLQFFFEIRCLHLKFRITQVHLRKSLEVPNFVFVLKQIKSILEVGQCVGVNINGQQLVRLENVSGID